MQALEWILLLVALALPGRISGITNRNGTRSKGGRVIGKAPLSFQQCASRIDTSMESMKKLQSYHTAGFSSSNSAVLDLSGYALHQPLRTASYDMYVTSMRVRVPAKPGWYRIEQCSFNPRNKSLETRLSFRDLTISGIVKLYDENAVLEDPLLPLPADVCNMTLRLRRAGLSIVTTAWHSSGPIDIRTVARFVEPDFVSVYAYGCRAPKIEHREGVNEEETAEERYTADFSREIEDVFVKGIQSLLATYMEKHLQTALKETLMTNIGYTISYGKRR